MKFNKELLLIPVLILLLILTIIGLKTYYPVLDVSATGMTVSGIVELCINHPPIIDFSNCLNETDVNVLYTCDVDVTDTDVNITFIDDSALFEINSSTGEFSFKPNQIKTYYFNITANDGSNCSNNEYSKIFNLSTGVPPVVIIVEPEEEEERRRTNWGDSFSRSSDVITRDINLTSEISVLFIGENTTHVVLRLINNGTVPLRNLSFDTYSADGLLISLNQNYLTELKSLEEMELILEFDTETKEGNYDIFIFVEAESEFNKHFLINVDLEKGTAILKDLIEFKSKKIGDLEFEYTLYDWIVIIFISFFIFLLLVKLIHKDE